MTPKDVLLNTKGAATQLGCSENWIHKLVRRGLLKSYVYNEEGTLVEREPETSRQGQGLYFYEKDLKAYLQKGHRGKGRPASSRKHIRKPAIKEAA